MTKDYGGVSIERERDSVERGDAKISSKKREQETSIWDKSSSFYFYESIFITDSDDINNHFKTLRSHYITITLQINSFSYTSFKTQTPPRTQLFNYLVVLNLLAGPLHVYYLAFLATYWAIKYIRKWPWKTVIPFQPLIKL